MNIINAKICNPGLDDSVRKGLLNPYKWLSRRERVGELYSACLMNYSGRSYSKAKFLKGLYGSFGHGATWNNSSGNPYVYGAVFNFDFTPDGSALVAATERRSILVLDPLTHKIHQVNTAAHQDCVNVVKFLDNKLFATCSDDRSVKIWDLRRMDKEAQTLTGHSNWVKNIECIGGKLLTSGFDGNIIMWDYNECTTNGEVPHKVLFQTRNLMRTALSPDQSKLIMSTSSGYIMVVHDFDINTIADDLKGFKPNIYRLMQMNPAIVNNSIAYNHLFQDNRKSNRLELIADFTENTDVEIVASLKVHPSGNYVVSRNNSSDEQCEHTCVHDLRHKTRTPVGVRVENEENLPSASSQYKFSLSVDSNLGNPSDVLFDGQRQATVQSAGPQTHIYRQRSRSRSPVQLDNEEQDQSEGSQQATSSTQSQSAAASIVLEQAEMLSHILPSAQERVDNLAANYSDSNDQFMIFIQGGSTGVHQTLVLFADDRRSTKKPQSPKDTKLVYYVEEPNMGRGFIKEPCFSNDGRIICSPFAHGVRLLSFDSECNELEGANSLEPSLTAPNKANELQEVASIYSHQNLVVATTYSPVHQLLVTGCLDGQIGFHQPVL